MAHYKEHRGFYIYGRNAIEEILTHTPDRIAEIFVIEGADAHKNEQAFNIAKSADIQITHLDEKRTEKLFGGVRTQGIGAYHRGFEYSDISILRDLCKDATAPLAVLVLDHIEDVHNFGAMVRTAAAAGVSAVIVAEHRQAPVTGAVFATSAGMVCRIPIIQAPSTSGVIEKLKEYDFWTYAIDMEEGSAEYPAGTIWEQDFDTHTAMVLGAEGIGLSHSARENCDFITPIPMEEGVESLNVSVATAIALYEWKRQQSL